MANTLFWKVTLGFSINNILVSIACLIQIIYVLNDVCVANDVNIAESIALLCVTATLLILSSYIIYSLKSHRLDKLSISGVLIVSALWLTQYGLIVHSLTSFCDSVSPLTIFFFIWTIVYSLVILAGVIGIIIGIYHRYGMIIALISSYGIITVIVAIIATVMQLLLVTSGECTGHMVTIGEGAFLLIFLFLSFCLVMVVVMETAYAQLYIKGILGCLFLLIACQYFLIIRAVDVLKKASCGDLERLREGTVILFIIWLISYTIVLFVMCCGALLKLCGQIQEFD
eukprot:100802_1